MRKSINQNKFSSVIYYSEKEAKRGRSWMTQHQSTIPSVLGFSFQVGQISLNQSHIPFFDAFRSWLITEVVKLSTSLPFQHKSLHCPSLFHRFVINYLDDYFYSRFPIVHLAENSSKITSKLTRKFYEHDLCSALACLSGRRKLRENRVLKSKSMEYCQFIT